MPGTSPSIDVVCFDLGGVLVRIADGWSHACERAGLGCRPPLRGRSAKELSQSIIRYESGKLSGDEFSAIVAQLVGDISTDEAQQLVDAWLVELFSGADQLLHALRKRGHKTACLSNTNERHWSIMHQSPAFAALMGLDHRVASHVIGHRKPDESSYACLEQAVGSTAEAILFFDDREENIAAARQRGWQVEQVALGGNPINAIDETLRRYQLL